MRLANTMEAIAVLKALTVRSVTRRLERVIAMKPKHPSVAIV